jgi:glycerophosphoryl diester phosphodiesterase
LTPLRHLTDSCRLVSAPVLALRRSPAPAFDGWGAHAALGRYQPGGTPAMSDLRHAVASGVSYIEIDVQVTADGHLVLRHDPTVMVRRPRPAVADPRRWGLPRRGDRLVDTPVQKLTLAELRAVIPHTMTLDEAVGVVGTQVPLLLDINSDRTAEPLGRWLALNRLRGDFTACTKSIATLTTLRAIVPDIPRELTLPDMPAEMRHPAWDIMRNFVLAGTAREKLSALGDLLQALADGHPRLRMGPFQGIQWRPYLREGLAEVAGAVGASGLCVHQWLVTRELVEAAHDLNLTIRAWTVNDVTAARRVAAAGVDMITSDRPEELRTELGRRGLRDLFTGRSARGSQLSA